MSNGITSNQNTPAAKPVINPADFRLADHFQDFDYLKLRARGKRAYFAVHTCWWGFDTYYTVPGAAHGLPCDPRGSVLMEAPAPDFIASAEKNPDYYGKHGLRAFAAAFHGNVLTLNGRPTSFAGWEVYNQLLDAVDAADAKAEGRA